MAANMLYPFANRNQFYRAVALCRPVLLISLYLTIASCGRSLQFLETEQTILFPTERGFAFRQIASIDSSEHLVFTDFRTHKQIVIYGPSGQIYRKIDLSELSLTEKRYFNNCYITDKYIVLSTEGKNRIILLDHEGKTLKHLDYSHLETSYGMDIWTPLLYHDSLLYLISDSYKLNMGIDPSEPILWMDNISNNDTIKVVIDSFFSQFQSHDYVCSDFLKYNIIDSSIIITTTYSDTIYHYSLEGRLYKKTPVKSKYFTTKIPPVPAERIQDLNHTLWHSGWIKNIVYDPYRKQYYCFVKGPHKYEKSRIFDFSIIIFNSKFIPLFEQEFDGNFFTSDCFVDKKGLYLMKRTNDGKSIFSLFKLQRA